MSRGTAQRESRYQNRLLRQGEENEDGDIIYEHEVQTKTGDTKTVEINATELFRPGERKTGRVDQLVIEAKLHDEGKGGGNPAKPLNSDVAKRAVERIESIGLEPAWRLVENPGDFP